MHASSCCKSDKHFKAKSLPFTSYKVRNPGLADAEDFRRLNLRQFLGFNKFPEISHKVSTHLKNCGFIRGKPQISKYVAGRIKNVLTHRLPSNLFVSLTSQFDKFRRSSKLDPTNFSGFIAINTLYKFLYIWQVQRLSLSAQGFLWIRERLLKKDGGSWSFLLNQIIMESVLLFLPSFEHF